MCGIKFTLHIVPRGPGSCVLLFPWFQCLIVFFYLMELRASARNPLEGKASVNT